MLFNSIEYFIFLAVVLLLYSVLPFKWQNRMLLVAGYVFYGWWDVRFLFLIAFSTTVDFTIGLLLEHKHFPRSQRWTASLYLIGAAALLLCPNWLALRSNATIGSVLTLQPLGIEVLIGTAIFVLVANLLINLALKLPEERRRRLLIFTSIFVNLTFLGFFKYFNFFVDSLAGAFRTVGINPDSLLLSVILPVGISFYTFQSLSYTIDVYRRRVSPTPRFWDFALFVAYFPPMVAGPIERGRHLLPQLLKPRRINFLQWTEGAALILYGLFKKVAIADGVAPAVNVVFNSTGAVSQSDVILATILFAIQIFCDFSGYSDIARGTSKLLGIDLIVNFNLPYFSKNPSEFWRRWNISLSSWLRDYLYISLGGNKRGATRTYANLMTTMLLGGLWHGAAWNYVLWGAYQGLLLCVHRFFTHPREQLPKFVVKETPREVRYAGPAPRRSEPLLYDFLKIGVFFVFCTYGWLLFRAHSFQQVADFTGLIFGVGVKGMSVIQKPTFAALIGAPVLAVLQLFDYRAGRLESFLRWSPPLQGALYALFLFVIVMGMSNEPVQFIYFQF